MLSGRSCNRSAVTTELTSSQSMGLGAVVDKNMGVVAQVQRVFLPSRIIQGKRETSGMVVPSCGCVHR